MELKDRFLRYVAILVLISLICSCCRSNEKCNIASLHTEIIPQPLSLVKGEGCFTIDAHTALICDTEVEKIADYLRTYLPIDGDKAVKEKSIRLTLDKELGAEEYALSVDASGIAICGGAYGGLFNGVQTLLQLLPHGVYGKSAKLPMSVPYVEVKDKPQYDYRGLLLDVARTFQPVDEVKRVIDYMAYLKLNKLHLHLVDNPAWRIEIKRYPKFAKVGGFRGGDSPLHPIHGSFDQKHGGYYTQEELRDIVAYAAERNIEVIPEIDMPGHSKALGVIHPDILCNYTPDTSNTNGIDIRNSWCVAKESNYTLIEDIVKELVEIFPSEYLHIGGDEVRFSCWEPCPDCQKLMKEKGLKDGHQLEQYFLNRVSKILTKHNRKSMVWDEAVEGSMLDKSTLVCGWRHKSNVKGWINSIKSGYQTIVMPSHVFYLDKRQSPHERGHRSTLGVSLKTVCDFSIESANFTPDETKCIAGIEGAFWSETYLPNITSERHFSDYLEYMFFPRIFAISEIAWSKERRSYDEMVEVMRDCFYYKLNAMGAAFRLEMPDVKVEDGKIYVTTEDGSQIYYTDIRTDKTRKYTRALDAELAPFVTFRSKLMSGYSNDVATPEFYTLRKEKFTLTSSMPFSEKCPASNCEAYLLDRRQLCRTARAAKEGDWLLCSFEKPIKCSYLRIATGQTYVHRCLIYNGYVEVSYDGITFVREGELYNGAFIIRPNDKQFIHAVRIVSTGISDAENCVIIQPLTIK
jgi:hexosaminidase